jgi:hypothetical protein
MKRYLPLLLVIVFPYFIVFSLFCIFTGFLIETFFQNNGLLLLLALIIIYTIAMICSIMTFIISLVKKRSAQEVARINMIVKLLHIPAYIIIFIIGLFGLITIFTMAISIVLVIMDCMTIFLTGLIGLGGIIRGLGENKLSKKEAVIHAIFQFVFCADIISSIIVYRKIKAPNKIIDERLKENN